MKEPNLNRKFGMLLLDAGKLKLADIELIEHCQKEQGLRFGEAAVKLGLVDEADILQTLAQQFNYPYLQPGEGGFSEELVAAYQPFTPQVEAIRNLRSQLTLRWLNEEHKQLALVGLGSGEACSFLAANLAVVFSQLGQRTVLVDANLRDPRQHQLFNLGKRQGLSDLLTGSIGMEAIGKIPSFADLSVLPAGTLPPNPQELLGRPAFKLLMRDLAKNYEIILVDTPDGLLYADTQNIVAETGAALLVAQKDHARISDAQALQSQIINAKAQVVGVVLDESR
jgi:chain length determinant protein tyrosine kinase EpsG